MHDATAPRPVPPVSLGICRKAAGLALGTVLLLTGCSSTGQTDATAGTATSTGSTTTAAGATDATTTATASATGKQYTVTEDTMFQTPTGNIGCVIGPDGVRCDILEHTFDAGEEPECEGDWGDSISMEKTLGAAELTCHGDTVLQQGQVLAYGESMTSGTYTCTSDTTGVVCEDSAGEHGFSLAKAAYEVH